MVIHRVVAGDTLEKIANMYGMTVENLIYENEIKYPSKLVIGQEIVANVDTIPHTVVMGDTLYKLSRRYGVTIDDILDANPDINPNNLAIGSTVYIPVGEKKLGDIIVNGYAVVPIDDTVLDRTAPNLTYISPFSYQVNADGSLTPIEDTKILDVSRGYGATPLLTVTNIKPGESFSSALASMILNNTATQDILIENMLSEIRQKGYGGVNVDFEYLYPTDRDSYTKFLGRVTDRMHEYGYIVAVALAPKINADQSGLLYEAHDYKAIGAIVDFVILMTYEWGYLYGPPLAISPIGPVSQVIEYATSVMDSQKILMGMPNYAYDWRIPYTPGTSARVLTNVEAVNQAVDVGASIEYDTRSQAPYYYYTDSAGQRHVVWFDNATSTYNRLLLVDKYDLAGVSYWNINNYFGQNWLVLNALFDIVKIGDKE